MRREKRQRKNLLVILNSEFWVADTFNHRIRKIAVKSNPPTTTHVQIGLFPGVTIFGDVGLSYRIEATQSLEDTNDWSTVTTVTLPRSPYTWFDEGSPGQQKRFYRATLLW